MKTLDQLEDNLAAVGWSLTKEEMERFVSSFLNFLKLLRFLLDASISRLDAASALPAPYPYEMINRLNKGRRRI